LIRDRNDITLMIHIVELEVLSDLDELADVECFLGLLDKLVVGFDIWELLGIVLEQDFHCLSDFD